MNERARSHEQGAPAAHPFDRIEGTRRWAMTIPPLAALAQLAAGRSAWAQGDTIQKDAAHDGAVEAQKSVVSFDSPAAEKMLHEALRDGENFKFDFETGTLVATPRPRNGLQSIRTEMIVVPEGGEVIVSALNASDGSVIEINDAEQDAVPTLVFTYRDAEGKLLEHVALTPRDDRFRDAEAFDEDHVEDVAHREI
jgi:hypothetical protein